MVHKKRKISSRLMISYLALILIFLFTASFIFFNYTKKTAYDEGVSNLIQVSDSVVSQIDNRLSNMEQVAVDVLIHVDFMKQWEKYLDDPEDTTAETALREILIDTFKSRSDIRSVGVFDMSGNNISTSSETIDKAEVFKRIKYLAERYGFNQSNSRAFLGPHDDFWIPSSQGTVISEVKPIKNSQKEIVGFIEIQQNVSYLERACKVSWNGQSLNAIVFMDSTDPVFYANYDTSDSEETVENLEKITRQYAQLRTTKNSVVATGSSNYYAYRVVIAMKNSVLYKALGNLLFGIIVIVCVLVIITVIYIFINTRMIMRPINSLIKRMQKIDLNNIDEINNEVYGDYETEILGSAFDNMQLRLKNAREKEKQLESVQTKTLFSILQQEISPHFLYNTLGSIANMCEAGDTKDAANACYNLTDIIRYAADFSVADVSLKEDVEQLQAYLSIMKSRYRQRLTYYIYVDDEVYYLQIPKLTLQPLVENAIKYSLLEQDEVVIHVNITSHNETICIEIADNGCGIDVEAAEKIQDTLDKFMETDASEEVTKNIQIGGMGLSGTLIRLSIFYGNGFYYEIKNNETAGTTIKLFISIRGDEGEYV